MAHSIEEFLQQQSQLYQHHLSMKSKTDKVLQHQHEIRLNKTIPKQYLPQKSLQLVLSNTTITSNYQQKYQELFFQHLDEVITNNTITLELEEAQMRQILSHTEKQLATLKATSATIAECYHQFTKTNNIQSHSIHPDLLKHLPDNPTHSQTSVLSKPTTSQNSYPPNPPPTRRVRKRPNPRQRKNTNKRLKQNLPNTPPLTHSKPELQSSSSLHFLGKRPPPTKPLK